MFSGLIDADLFETQRAGRLLAVTGEQSELAEVGVLVVLIEIATLDVFEHALS